MKIEVNKKELLPVIRILDAMILESDYMIKYYEFTVGDMQKIKIFRSKLKSLLNKEYENDCLFIGSSMVNLIAYTIGFMCHYLRISENNTHIKEIKYAESFMESMMKQFVEYKKNN